MQTDTGVNLLSPGKTPNKNLQFLAFYASVVRAVYKHNYLLISSVCTLNNSYRLGGHEAPPAVMSIFSGSTLTSIFDRIMKMKDPSDLEAGKASIQMVSSIPDLVQDNTDRNRTSPFAFTGNRFEFRAVGSSANAAGATYVLNSIVAESLNEFRKEVDELEAKGETRQAAILTVIRKFITESQNVMFEGNGYSKEWEAEAAKRGLRAVRNVPDAYKVFLEEDSVSMFDKLGVLTPRRFTFAPSMPISTSSALMLMRLKWSRLSAIALTAPVWRFTFLSERVMVSSLMSRHTTDVPSAVIAGM